MNGYPADDPPFTVFADPDIRKRLGDQCRVCEENPPACRIHLRVALDWIRRGGNMHRLLDLIRFESLREDDVFSLPAQLDAADQLVMEVASRNTEHLVSPTWIDPVQVEAWDRVFGFTLSRRSIDLLNEIDLSMDTYLSLRDTWGSYPVLISFVARYPFGEEAALELRRAAIRHLGTTDPDEVNTEMYHLLAFAEQLHRYREEIDPKHEVSVAVLDEWLSEALDLHYPPHPGDRVVMGNWLLQMLNTVYMWEDLGATPKMLSDWLDVAEHAGPMMSGIPDRWEELSGVAIHADSVGVPIQQLADVIEAIRWNGEDRHMMHELMMKLADRISELDPAGMTPELMANWIQHEQWWSEWGKDL